MRGIVHSGLLDQADHQTWYKGTDFNFLSLFQIKGVSEFCNIRVVQTSAKTKILLGHSLLRRFRYQIDVWTRSYYGLFQPESILMVIYHLIGSIILSKHIFDLFIISKEVSK